MLGLPGAGKSTIGRMVAERLQVPYISQSAEVGKLLQDTEDTLGDRLRTEMAGNHWQPLSDAAAIEIARRHIDIDASHGWVYDGFPRSVTQARALGQSVLGIYLRVSPLVGGQRALRRNRLDDTDDTINRRIWLDSERLAPVVAYLRSKHTVLEIDADQSLEDVVRQIQEAAAFAEG